MEMEVEGGLLDAEQVRAKRKVRGKVQGTRLGSQTTSAWLPWLPWL